MSTIIIIGAVNMKMITGTTIAAIVGATQESIEETLCGIIKKTVHKL